LVTPRGYLNWICETTNTIKKGVASQKHTYNRDCGKNDLTTSSLIATSSSEIKGNLKRDADSDPESASAGQTSYGSNVGCSHVNAADNDDDASTISNNMFEM
jgi:hypothetical protein